MINLRFLGLQTASSYPRICRHDAHVHLLFFLAATSILVIVKSCIHRCQSAVRRRAGRIAAATLPRLRAASVNRFPAPSTISIAFDVTITTCLNMSDQSKKRLAYNM